MGPISIWILENTVIPRAMRDDFSTVTLGWAAEMVGRVGPRRVSRLALLDSAQDYLLWLLADEGLFDDGRLIFKGGTSLRKCRLGTSGRFSTDLDFTAPDDDIVIAACEVINGAVVGGFTFILDNPSDDGAMISGHRRRTSNSMC